MHTLSSEGASTRPVHEGTGRDLTYARQFDNWDAEDAEAADAAGLLFILPQRPEESGHEFLSCIRGWYHSEGKEAVSAYELRVSLIYQAAGYGFNDPVMELPFTNLHLAIGDVTEQGDFVQVYRRGLGRKAFRNESWTPEMRSIHGHLMRAALRSTYKTRGEAEDISTFVKYRRAKYEYAARFENPKLELLSEMRMRHAMALFVRNRYGAYGNADEETKVKWLQGAMKNNPVLQDLMSRGYTRGSVMEHYIESILMNPLGQLGEHEVAVFSETFFIVVSDWETRYPVFSNPNDYEITWLGTVQQPADPSTGLSHDTIDSSVAYLKTVNFPNEESEIHFKVENSMALPPTIHVSLSTQKWSWIPTAIVETKIRKGQFVVMPAYSDNITDSNVEEIRRAAQAGRAADPRSLAAPTFMLSRAPPADSETAVLRSLIIRLYPDVLSQWKSIPLGLRLPHAFDFSLYEKLSARNRRHVRRLLKQDTRVTKRKLEQVQMTLERFRSGLPMNEVGADGAYGLYAAPDQLVERRGTIHTSKVMSARRMEQWIRDTTGVAPAELLEWASTSKMDGDALRYRSKLALGREKRGSIN